MDMGNTCTRLTQPFQADRDPRVARAPSAYFHSLVPAVFGSG